MLEWIVTAERWGEEVAEEEDAEIVFVGGGSMPSPPWPGGGVLSKARPKGPRSATASALAIMTRGRNLQITGRRVWTMGVNKTVLLDSQYDALELLREMGRVIGRTMRLSRVIGSTMRLSRVKGRVTSRTNRHMAL